MGVETPTMARILVVEDDREVRKAVLRTFQRAHQLVEACDGETALAIARHEEFDVALVDYQLGIGLNGIEVLAQLQKLQPYCARLLMTGDPDYDVVKTALNSGAVIQLVTKPFKVQTVEDAVTRAVEWSLDTPRGKERRARSLFAECVMGEHLSLAVQPIVGATAPHAPIAFECLLRSSHPRLPGPKEVIDTVLEGKLVYEFGAVVNALAARWAEVLPTDAYIFVNTHAEQFSDPDLVERFAPLLPFANRVILEITEGSDLEAVENWETAIETLNRLGFRYAVDDVGAGWNGLKLLANLSPSFIKVDMSIVRNVHRQPRKQRLVELLGRFAAADGSRVVAEGVETAEEAATLAACGAHYLQGFYFCRPSRSWPEIR